MVAFIRLFSVLFICFCTIAAKAQEPVVRYECKVSVDIINVTKERDRVRVTIIPPPLNSKRIKYVLPAYLPGIGKRVDATQFVHEFYALDDQGQPIKAVKKGNNVILLKPGKGRSLRKIEYWVDDTWDPVDGKSYHNGNYSHVPNAAGTSFDTENGFLLNPAFICGYFEGYAWIPYRLTVLHSDNLNPFTGMTLKEKVKGRDQFVVNSYNDFVEYPLFYGKADTCGFQSRNVYVDVAVVSESGNISARQIRKYLGAQVFATTRFVGDIAPRHYKMLFWFIPPDKYKSGFQGVFGGVSHRNSAVYYLTEIPEDDQMAGMIARETSGDLLKMLRLLDYTQSGSPPDYQQPQVSPCWWMAEGMKSYFTWLSELRDSVSNETDFMAAISAKMRLYEKVKEKPLTDVKQLQKAIQIPLVAEEYKAKAMLLVFMLDIHLTQWTGGTKGLREVVLDLNDSAGFKADSMCHYIERNLTGEIRIFCDKYLRGTEQLPVIQSCDKIGWVYSPTALDSMLTFGQVSLTYDDAVDAFIVRQAEAGNKLGVQAGDRMVSVNGISVNAVNLDAVLTTIYSPQSTEEIEVIYIRNNTNERLMASPYYRTLVIEHLVRPDPAAGPDAELLHARIFSPMDY